MFFSDQWEWKHITITFTLYYYVFIDSTKIKRVTINCIKQTNSYSKMVPPGSCKNKQIPKMDCLTTKGFPPQPCLITMLQVGMAVMA